MYYRYIIHAFANLGREATCIPYWIWFDINYSWTVPRALYHGCHTLFKESIFIGLSEVQKKDFAIRLLCTSSGTVQAICLLYGKPRTRLALICVVLWIILMLFSYGCN